VSVNRLADGYQPDFDIDAEFGRQGELFVLELVDSIKAGRAEVKRDDRAFQTGKVFIETACMRAVAGGGRDYVPSGIRTSQSDVWAIVLGNPPSVAIVAPTLAVRELSDYAERQGWTREAGQRGSHPTRGVVVSQVILLSLIDRMSRLPREAA